MKSILTVIYLLFLVNLASFAQEIIWQKTIGGSMRDELLHLQQTSDGGYILGGTSLSGISGDKTENTNGQEDFWLVKTDSVGNIQWQNTIGGSGIDKLSKVIQTFDGGYVVGGTSGSTISGDKSENNIGLDDYWIVKLDAGGNVLWDNTIGGTAKEQLYDLVQTNDGGLMLAGSSKSDSSSDKSENSLGAEDYWIVKTNSQGIVQWENTIGGTNGDVLKAIQQTPDGGFVLGGASSSPISGDKTDDTFGLRDYWIVKIDSLGMIQWQKTIGGNNDEIYNSLQLTADGGFVLGGVSTSPISGNKTVANFNGADPWIVKLDSTGNINWQNNIGSISADFCEIVKQVSDGGYLFGSWSNQGIAGNRTVNTKGGSDYWLIKLDAAGSIVWQRSIGGSATEAFRWFEETGDGQYMLAGFSTSNISGDKSENSRGLEDFWIVKFTDTYNIISGKVFIDNNSNGVMDSGDQALPNHRLIESNTANVAFSRSDGRYNLSVLDTGQFMVSPKPLPYFTAVPIQQSANFNGTSGQDSLKDFAFQANAPIQDLQIGVVAFNNFRPGFKGHYYIHCKNAGSIAQAATITFIGDNGIAFDSSTLAPTFQSPDTVVWQLGILQAAEYRNFILTVQIDSAIGIGTLIDSQFSIDPVSGDSTPANNSLVKSIVTRGSFDPNDIAVNRSTVFTNELASPPYLEYTIRFQNTGTDTAFNVKINNPISLNADMSSFELIETSHPLIMNYSASESTMWFEFYNILLPDSNVNEAMSHGFVKYKIKPKSNLTSGEYISNKVYIYFDYNVAVPTNIVFTYITLPTNISEINQDAEIALYPNPATEEINIFLKLTSPETLSFDIYNLLGEKVMKTGPKNFLAGENMFSIQLSDLSPGIYIVQTNSSGKSFSKRIVKM